MTSTDICVLQAYIYTILKVEALSWSNMVVAVARRQECPMVLRVPELSVFEYPDSLYTEHHLLRDRIYDTREYQSLKYILSF